MIDLDRITILQKGLATVLIFSENEIVAGSVCNQTQVVATLAAQLHKSNLRGLPGIAVFVSNLTAEQLIFKRDLHTDFIEHMYVKSSINSELYYVAALLPERLLQHQIIFWRLGVYIEIFTTEMVLHIKNLLQKDCNSLARISSLDELRLLVTQNEAADLYTKTVQTMFF